MQGFRLGALALGAAVMLAAAGASYAQDKAALVKARQDFMEHQQDDVNVIGKFFKGSGDQASAVAAASDLLAVAPKIPDQFTIPGTGMDAVPKSKTKPEIFQHLDKVKALVANLQTLEQKLLETVKAGDPAAVRAQLVATYREGCTACHTDYRAAD